MSLCKECVSGVTHEGVPTGKFEEINGVNTYVALPETDFPKDKAILLVTDVFGVKLINNKLLADDFARNGFQVYMPDIFNNDPVPEDALGPNSNFDLYKWLANGHSPQDAHIPVDKVTAGLRARGITTFGGTGYCYGARILFDLAKENAVSSVVVAHPSLLNSPADFEDVAAKSKVPLLINSCEFDERFPAEFCAKADEILGGGKYKPGYVRKHWVGCTHGFAVRGDMSIPQVKAGKEGAFKATVEWFLNL